MMAHIQNEAMSDVSIVLVLVNDRKKNIDLN